MPPDGGRGKNQESLLLRDNDPGITGWGFSSPIERRQLLRRQQIGDHHGKLGKEILLALRCPSGILLDAGLP
jgi:hypothetical protein